MAESAVTNKPGVAFIVSNNYDCTAKLETLKGAHKDAEKIAGVFRQLGYEVVVRKNLVRDEFVKLVNEAASLPYTPSYRRLVFTFSGHGVVGDTLYDQYGIPRGNASGKLCCQDGREIEIESIIDQFKPDKYPALGKMARLFFFDVCRGSEEDKGVPLHTRGIVEKGGKFLVPDTRVPKDGNILVAYSTLPYHKAYEMGSGSLWVKFLTEGILNQNDDISAILTDVNSKLQEAHKRFPVLQTSQFINQLTERVNFLGELLTAIGQTGNSTIASAITTPPCVPVSQPMAVCSPQSVMKPAVTRLQEYCQQNNLPMPAYKEFQVVGGFYWTVAVRDKQYSGERRSGKQEAKHSAAEVALQQLDRSNLANRGASSGSFVKELKEKYFDKNKIVFKKDDYFKTTAVDGGFQCTLRINRTDFTSKKCQSKSDAENGAAKQALKHFNLTI